MARSLGLALFIAILATTCSLVAGEWIVLNLLKQLRPTASKVGISLENYCTSWRANVEVNNVRGFDGVPGECAGSIGRYLTSSLQYTSDVQRTAEECTLYLTNSFKLAGDGKDAWIFDVDETLLSTLPFHEKHRYGADEISVDLLEKWMLAAKAPALDHVLCLYKLIKARGLKIFLLSSRREHLKAATVDNLVTVGYHSWDDLILRSPRDTNKTIEEFKAEQRKKIADDGYRIWAVVSSQWSNLFGSPAPMRIFKLPNPMYYEA